MRTIISICCVAMVFFTVSVSASEKTANGVLANPAKFEDQNVNLDVAFLRPVRWNSPVPEVALFYAMTYDKRNRSFGGEILLAAPESAREGLIRRYGVTRDGGRASAPSTNSLRGTLRNTGVVGPRGTGLWFVDQTNGKVAEALKEKRESLGKLLQSDSNQNKEN